MNNAKKCVDMYTRYISRKWANITMDDRMTLVNVVIHHNIRMHHNPSAEVIA